MRATLGTHKDFGQTCGACQVNCARRVSIRCIALAGTSVGWSSVILFFFLPPSCVPWLHARYAILSRYTQPESRTPDIGCLKMSASPEVQPPGLQSTGLRRCPCLKKADRFGSAPSRTSECANRPQITEKSTGLCQEFWHLTWNESWNCSKTTTTRLACIKGYPVLRPGRKRAAQHRSQPALRITVGKAIATDCLNCQSPLEWQFAITRPTHPPIADWRGGRKNSLFCPEAPPPFVLPARSDP